MWPDGYYFQRTTFYFSKWSKEMEKTFVNSLVEQAKAGRFKAGSENKDALMKAMEDVNKKHDTKVCYDWVKDRVKSLRERYEVFSWVINHPGVVWNQRFRFVTAADDVWKAMRKEKKLSRCYINAYEDLWDELYFLFAPPPEDDPPAAAEQEIDLNVPKIEEEPVVPEGTIVVNPINLPLVVHIPDSSDSSSSILGFIRDYYGTDSDDDSVLPPPGVPRSIAKKEKDGLVSSTSSHSQERTSSTASNATPLKKKG
ncbi:hypothetical protein Salat_0867100 [Sesamum alatum]|uniref:Myb/SANT-like domain-containing protein n=1 Tax=Sesamum alatum TaxID=300844 RepID=A0AAE1YIV8_9LAMI|nr:hypothetical protein Salat_0867100 [Sesamum alatum]